jgi:hypothetical protein
MINLQKQLIDDAQGTYRFKQIEEDGNDPALNFLKSKGEESGGSGGSGGGDTGGNTGGDEAGGGETGGGAEAGGAAGGAEAGGTPPLTEKKRDQTGRKDARKYPFGEDPLGTLENNRDSDLSPTHKYKNKSPLSMESISSLVKAFNSHKDILKESQNKPSFMDENNIKE